MAGFYYFFESDEVLDGARLNHDYLESCQLGSLSDVHAVPDQAVHSRVRGPSGKEGHCLYPKPEHREQPQKWTYDAERQTWLDRGAFWIGWDNANKPTPQDLLRARACGGLILTDESGSQWTIPVVVSPADRSTLPVDYSFTPEGKLVHRVKKRHERYHELAREAANYLWMLGEVDREELESKFPEENVIKYATEFLSINYRVGVHEVAALVEADRPILDSDFAVFVFRAVTDWRKVETASGYLEQKKKVRLAFVQSLLKPSPGSEDSSQDTDPAKQTCS